MKFKQKFPENHNYKGYGSCCRQHAGIFYMALAIMIFMNATSEGAINAPTHPNNWKWLEERTNAAAAGGVPATTMLQTLSNNAMRNPIIAQQSSKTSAPQKPTASVTSTSMPANSASNGSHTSTPNLTPAQAMGSCKSSTGTWGDVDPNIFYLCDMQTKQPLTMRCPEGRGYFNGLGYSGCIPFEEWPACVALSAHEQVHICDSEHMQQPWETMNPNKFYICLQETTEPMLLNCGQGKGFLHVRISSAPGSSREEPNDGDSEIVGCANWEKWRSYMQCTDYY
uniref:Chitin-binding type-2 domain-containing protein n=1 Tax=Stomoxys calcitrans TaxID=35570 RepID=A0A1I8PP44_STOCA